MPAPGYDEEMVTPQQETRTMQWIAGALAAIVMAGGSFWLTYVGAQVDSLRDEQKTEQRDNAMVRERLRGVETKLEAVDATTKQTGEDVRQIRDSLQGQSRRSSESGR